MGHDRRVMPRRRHRRHRPLPDRPRAQGLAARRCAPTTSPPPSSGPRWTRCPQLDPTDIDDLYLGCGLPGGEQGFNMARVVAILLGYDHLPGATLTRYCASSLQTTRMAFHAIKAGEGDVFVSAGVEMVSRYARGNSDGLPPEAQALVGGGWQNPRLRRGAARAPRRAPPAARRPGHDPREDGELPDIYLAMGQTAENLAQVKGVTREDMDEFGVRQPEPRREGDRRRLLGPRDHPGHAAGRHRGRHRRRPAARRDAGGASPASSRCSARTAGSPPATAARSTTAPPRWSS